jgi:two-component system NtrC family sensor kinase
MTVRATVRTFLLLNALALAAVAAVAPLALGLPLAARRTLGPAALGAIAAAVALLVLVVGVALLFRGVARPLDRLLAAAARLGAAERTSRGELPIMAAPGEPGGFALTRAAVAFERLALAFEEERAELGEKVRELTGANRALAEARESLLRSEKLATVGRLAAGLAHEVGNPLGAVAGYVELARARLPADPHPDLVDALARISTAAERIDRTVRDLLDFARPSAPALAPIDLTAALDASLRLARVQARFKHVEVELDLPERLPRVEADEHHVAQVLLNLFLNAGDAMGGVGRVRVSAHAEEGARVILAVEDGGPGIAAGDLPHVFDPFFTTKDAGEGTGLGLAISHRIMEGFGGEIAARNGERGGAVFELRFHALPEPSCDEEIP